MKQYKGKRSIAWFMAATIALMPLLNTSALTYREVEGPLPGNPIISETRDIAPGIQQNAWKSINDAGKPVVFQTLTLDTLNPETGAKVWSGGVLVERNTLSALVSNARATGYPVVGAVNGDFFNIKSGSPLGFLVRDGEIYSSDGTNYLALGFRSDGSAVMGNPNLQYALYRNGQRLYEYHLNKDEGDFGPYVYSNRYGPRAGSNELGVDVVVNFPATRLSVGTAVEGQVAEVRLDTQGTPIGQNQMVLSARTGKNGYTGLSNMQAGDIIRLEVLDMDGQWTGVTEALGGMKSLLAGGVPVADLSATNVNPATIIGKKADGRVIVLEVDGRQASWSNGISYAEAARLMMQLGCSDAMVCDGGGSSTFYARTPGEYYTRLINRPSDGGERAISNALLFYSKTLPAGPVDLITNLMPREYATKLHLYPGKQYLLPGSSTSWETKATDNGYHPTVVPTGLTWSSNGGVFTPDGTMVAAGIPGFYQVTAGNGLAIGTASFIVPDQLSEIRVSQSALVVSAGKSIDLTAVGYLEGIAVRGVDASFTWWVDPSLGTVTADGIFTAANVPEASGTMTVSWGPTVAQVSVYIAREPQDIETFETTPAWTWTNILNSKSAVRSVLDEKAVYGDGLLRMYYDFRPATNADKGAASIEAGPSSLPDANGLTTVQPILLSGNPTAVGLWVYGDESFSWLRARLNDANGTAFDIDYTKDYMPESRNGGIDWTGWKYVEAQIPKGAVAPYTLTAPIRVMCTREEMKGSGYLYFDRLRTVYGEANDDLTPPEVTGITPAGNAVLSSGVVAITATLEDKGGSGINFAKSSMLVDGIKQASALISGDAGKATAFLVFGEDKPLAGGYHTVTLAMEDGFGNKSVKTTQFFVDTKTPQVSLSVPENVAAGEQFDVVVNLKNPNPMKAMDLQLVWDAAKIDILDQDSKKAGVQIGIEKYVSDAKITKNTIEAAKGVFSFSVSALNSTIKTMERKMLTLRFRAKTSANSTAALRTTTAVMKSTTAAAAQTFSLPAQSVTVSPTYILDVSNIVTGGITRFSVTDRNGSPVEGAAIAIDGSKKTPFAVTGKNGTVDTKAVGVLPAGTKMTLRATKGGLVSTTIPVVVTEAARGGDPIAVSISPISKPGGMAFHWLSEASKGTVQLIKTAQYDGTMPANAISAAASNTALTVTDPTGKKKLFEHKAVFYDLDSGTQYTWRITDTDIGTGKTGSFRTPVSDAGSAFSFGFVTDPQAVDTKGYAPFSDVVQRMLGNRPKLSFILFGGDMVDDGSKQNQWWSLFQASATWMHRIPTLTVPGNHEYKDAKLSTYHAFWGLPATGPKDFAETAYTVQNGDARFYMLDTQGNMDTQLNWLKKEKSASNSQWDIVVMHRGIYGCFYDEAEYRKKAAPVFDALGIDLVLSGHDHTWSRTTMKGGKKVLPGTGTTYVSGGAAGGKFYDAKKRTWTEILYDGNTPSFTVVDVTDKTLTISASHVENNKTVLHDRFMIQK